MKLSPFLAGAAALALALPAAAAPRANVSFNDLDFSKASDVAAFNARLEAAAKKACNGEAKMQLNDQRKFVRCETLVKDQALARLPKDRITALASAQPSEGVAAM
jgi:UrcA family protein